ncbi:ATP-binding protein [[Flexibacter] sp. ATCC 35208]|uniref:ATP-binding protein n=1 Tax=unclassified Chitinophaga TaxID=2619133 RepID=UPI0034D17D72
MPTEINELDWKSTLSDKSDRLAQHLSAFSNLPGGVFLIFGVYDDGSIKSVDPMR